MNIGLRALPDGLPGGEDGAGWFVKGGWCNLATTEGISAVVRRNNENEKSNQDLNTNNGLSNVAC